MPLNATWQVSDDKAQLNQIETERLLADLVRVELNRRRSEAQLTAEWCASPSPLLPLLHSLSSPLSLLDTAPIAAPVPHPHVPSPWTSQVRARHQVLSGLLLPRLPGALIHAQ